MFDLQREVSQPLIDELELIGNEQLVVSGHKLIKEGTIDGSIYVLKAGAFSVITSNALGEQLCLADLGPGSVKTPLVAGLFASYFPQKVVITRRDHQRLGHRAHQRCG